MFKFIVRPEISHQKRSFFGTQRGVPMMSNVKQLIQLSINGQCRTTSRALAIITVRQLPMNESRSTSVSLEPRNGTCRWPWSAAARPLEGTPLPCLATTIITVRPGDKKKCGLATLMSSESCGPTTQKRYQKNKKNEKFAVQQGVGLKSCVPTVGWLLDRGNKIATQMY